MKGNGWETKYITVCVWTLVCFFLTTAEGETLLADNFDTSINAEVWSILGNKTPVVNAGNLVVETIGSNGSQRSAVVSQRSDYDFFKQPLIITLSDIELFGEPGEGANTAYLFFGQTKGDDTESYYPRKRTIKAALIFRLIKDVAGFSLGVEGFAERKALGDPLTLALDQTPKSISLTLDGANRAFSIEVTGAKFVSTGLNIATEYLPPIRNSDLAMNSLPCCRLAIGVLNAGNVKSASKMTLGSIQIQSGQSVSVNEKTKAAATDPTMLNGKFSAVLGPRSGVAICGPGEKNLQLTVSGMQGDTFCNLSISDLKGTVLTSQENIPFSLENELKSTIPLTLSAPASEGVYWAEATVKDRCDDTVTSRMQFIVVDPELKPAVPQQLARILVKEINCTEKPDPDDYLQGDGNETYVATNALGAFRFTGTRSKNIYPPSAHPNNINLTNRSWFAYRIAVPHPGKAHQIELTYPDDDLRAFDISLYQPNNENNLGGLQVHSGVITGGDYPNSQTVKTHGIYFWPTGDHVLVLIANWMPGKRAAVGKIRLYEIPDGLPAAELNLPSEKEQRHMGLYYEEARMPDNFGGARGPEDRLRRWPFFYDSARNLTEYMRFAGLDTLLYLSIGYMDALFPTELSSLGKRYNDDVDDADPVRKDILELYFRLFDREGFHLIPQIKFGDQGGNIKFETRMAAAGVPEAEYRCYSIDGTLTGVKKARSGPVYDPLSPYWQAYVRDVVKEMAERYCQHPSFSGIGLRITGSTSIVYPDFEWGYGDAIITRFEQDTGIDLPDSTENAARFALRKDALQGKYREAFLSWRESEITAFLAELAGILENTRGDLDLFVSYFPGLDITSFKSRKEAVLMADSSWNQADYRRGVGAAFEQWGSISNLVTLRYRRDGGAFPYQVVEQDRAGEYLKEQNFSVDLFKSLVGSAPVGSVSYFNYFESRLDEFALKVQKKWYEQAQIWLISTLVPVEPYELEPFAFAANRLNPQYQFWGGFHAPAGREQDLRRFAQAFRALPQIPLRKSSCSVQPVGIHEGLSGEHGWVCVVNESFAPADVNLTMGASGSSEVAVIPPIGSVIVSNGTATVDFSLEAYSMVTLRSDQSSLSVTKANIRPGDFYTKSLKDRSGEVDAILRKVANPIASRIRRDMSQMITEARWIDLWELLNSATVFNAVTENDNSGKTRGQIYYDLK